MSRKPLTEFIQLDLFSNSTCIAMSNSNFVSVNNVLEISQSNTKCDSDIEDVVQVNACKVVELYNRNHIYRQILERGQDH